MNSFLHSCSLKSLGICRQKRQAAGPPPEEVLMQLGQEYCHNGCCSCSYPDMARQLLIRLLSCLYLLNLCFIGILPQQPISL